MLLSVCCGILLISRLSSGYEATGNVVLFRSFNNLNWKIERRLVKGADSGTIQTLRRSGGLYATDGTSVFFEGNPLTAADPATFRVLDWRHGFSNDAKYGYWKSSRISDDAAHFEPLAASYSKDSHNVYHCGRVVVGADPATFAVINKATSHARDQAHEYNLGRRIADVERQSHGGRK